MPAIAFDRGQVPMNCAKWHAASQHVQQYLRSKRQAASWLHTDTYQHPFEGQHPKDSWTADWLTWGTPQTAPSVMRSSWQRGRPPVCPRLNSTELDVDLTSCVSCRVVLCRWQSW